MKHLSPQLWILLLSIPILNGCVGFVAVYPKDSTPIEHPSIGSEKASYYPGSAKEPTACTDLETRWGEPNLKSTDGSESTLTYKSGFVWAGLVPFVGIPIPLVLPVWRKHATFVCKDGVVVTASGNVTGYAGAYCGIISERPDYGCKSENSNF
jgi:hypothetical protein